MEQEEQSVSFGKVLKVAVKNWKRFLIVSVAVAAAGSCAFIFGYNTLKTNYVSEFTYNTSDLKNEKYLDGSDFFYSRIIGSDNLLRAKATSEDFNSIDIQKILDKSAISISKNVVQTTEKTADYSYTITIGKKYFSSEKQAKAFIDEVASYPIHVDSELANKDHFSTNLDAFESANTFEKQLSYLEGQANLLDSSYVKLLSDESLSSAIAGSIRANIIELNSIVGEKEKTEETTTAQSQTTTSTVTTDTATRKAINQLRYIVNENGFVLDYNAPEALAFEATKKALEAEKSLNSQKITALENEINNLTTSVTVTTIDAEIAKLTERNTEIDYEIAAISKKIANKDNTDPTYVASLESFKSTLSTYKEKLSDCTGSYVDVVKKIYVNNADVSYKNSNIVSKSGELSIASSIIISVLGGVVVGGVTNLIVDRKKLHE